MGNGVLPSRVYSTANGRSVSARGVREHARRDLEHLEHTGRDVVLAVEPVPVGGDEPEAAVVDRAAEDDDERMARGAAAREAGAHQGAPDALPVQLGVHGERGEPEANGTRGASR